MPKPKAILILKPVIHPSLHKTILKFDILKIVKSDKVYDKRALLNDTQLESKLEIPPPTKLAKNKSTPKVRFAKTDLVALILHIDLRLLINSQNEADDILKSITLSRSNTSSDVVISSNTKVSLLFKGIKGKNVKRYVDLINHMILTNKPNSLVNNMLNSIINILKLHNAKLSIVDEIGSTRDSIDIDYSKYPIDLLKLNILHHGVNEISLRLVISVLKKIDRSSYSQFTEFQTKYRNISNLLLSKFMINNTLNSGYSNKMSYSILLRNAFYFNYVLKFPKPLNVTYQSLVDLYNKYNVRIIVLKDKIVNRSNILHNTIYSHIPPIDQFSSRLRNQLASMTTISDISPKRSISVRRVNNMLYDRAVVNIGLLPTIVANFYLVNNNSTLSVLLSSNSYIYGTIFLDKLLKTSRDISMWGLRGGRTVNNLYILSAEGNLQSLGQRKRLSGFDTDLGVKYFSYFSSFNSTDGLYRYGFIPKMESSKLLLMLHIFRLDAYIITKIYSLLNKFNYSTRWTLFSSEGLIDKYSNNLFNVKLILMYKNDILILHLLNYLYTDATTGITNLLHAELNKLFSNVNIRRGLYNIFVPIYNLSSPDSYLSLVMKNDHKLYNNNIQAATFIKTFFKYTSGDGLTHSSIPLSNHAYLLLQTLHPKGSYLGFKKVIASKAALSLPLSLKYDIWKLYIIGYVCNNFALNLICPAFPQTFNLVIVKDPTNLFTDSFVIRLRQKRAFIANHITNLLKLLKSYSTILNVVPAFLSRDVKLKIFKINKVYKGIGDRIGNLANSIADTNLSTHGVVFASSNIGRSLLKVIRMCRLLLAVVDIYKFTQLKTSEGLNGVDFLAKYTFLIIYGIYCLNSILGVVHSDLHLNNVTIGLRVSDDHDIDKLNAKVVYTLHGDNHFIFPYINMYGGIIDFSRAGIIPNMTRYLKSEKGIYRKYADNIDNPLHALHSIQDCVNLIFIYLFDLGKKEKLFDGFYQLSFFLSLLNRNSHLLKVQLLSLYDTLNFITSFINSYTFGLKGVNFLLRIKKCILLLILFIYNGKSSLKLFIVHPLLKVIIKSFAQYRKTDVTKYNIVDSYKWKPDFNVRYEDILSVLRQFYKINSDNSKDDTTNNIIHNLIKVENNLTFIDLDKYSLL